jgi:hypothetical protein
MASASDPLLPTRSDNPEVDPRPLTLPTAFPLRANDGRLTAFKMNLILVTRLLNTILILACIIVWLVSRVYMVVDIIIQVELWLLLVWNSSYMTHGPKVTLSITVGSRKYKIGGNDDAIPHGQHLSMSWLVDVVFVVALLILTSVAPSTWWSRRRDGVAIAGIVLNCFVMYVPMTQSCWFLISRGASMPCGMIANCLAG